MIQPLKPLSKEEREALKNRSLYPTRGELLEYIDRALATIDQMEQRQQKLREALKNCRTACIPLGTDSGNSTVVGIVDAALRWMTRQKR